MVVVVGGLWQAVWCSLGFAGVGPWWVWGWGMGVGGHLAVACAVWLALLCSGIMGLAKEPVEPASSSLILHTPHAVMPSAGPCPAVLTSLLPLPVFRRTMMTSSTTRHLQPRSHGQGPVLRLVQRLRHGPAPPSQQQQRQQQSRSRCLWRAMLFLTAMTRRLPGLPLLLAPGEGLLA